MKMEMRMDAFVVLLLDSLTATHKNLSTFGWMI